MKKIILLVFLSLLFSCKTARVLLEENILKIELSTTIGTAPLTIEAKCEIAHYFKEVPCLDEEWYCWFNESIASGDYLNKIFVENECEGDIIKRNFSMDFIIESPGTYAIELVLKRKNGEIFARILSYPIKVKSR